MSVDQQKYFAERPPLLKGKEAVPRFGPDCTVTGTQCFQTFNHLDATTLRYTCATMSALPHSGTRLREPRLRTTYLINALWEASSN